MGKGGERGVSKSLDDIQQIVFEGEVMAWHDPTEEIIAAAQAVSAKNKPRFVVSIMLSVLNKTNRNGHHITFEQAQKAIASYGDRQEIPGNLDHKTGAYGTSYKLWIKDPDANQPELYLEAIYWNRYISKTKKAELMASYHNKTLGASWEIDRPFKLVADEDDPETTYIEDFAFAGFGLMVGDSPAEEDTQGTATITSGLDADPCFWGDKVAPVLEATDAESKAQERRATKYGIGIKEGGNVTKPDKCSKVTAANFADPVNYKWLIGEDHIAAAIACFNQPGMRAKGHYTTAEWAKVGCKIARKAGEDYIYRGGKVAPGSEVALLGKDVMKTDLYGELPVDFLRSIPCPTCGAWAKITKLDFKEGVFALECMNGRYDEDRPSHKFSVSVAVKAEGEVTSSFHLAPVESSEALQARTLTNDNEVIEVKLVATKDNKEVSTVEAYTQEQMDAAIAKADKDAKDKLKADQDALETQQKAVDEKVKTEVATKVKGAKEAAVAAYKAREADAVARLSAAHEAMPYESDELKQAAREELMAMSQEDFDTFIAMRKKEGEIAALKAQLADGAAGGMLLKAGYNGGAMPKGEDLEKPVDKNVAAQKAESERLAKMRW